MTKDGNSSLLLRVAPFKTKDLFKAYKLISGIYNFDFKVDISRESDDDLVIRVKLHEGRILLASRVFYKGSQLEITHLVEDPKMEFNYISPTEVYQNRSRVYFIATELRDLKSLIEQFEIKNCKVEKIRKHLIPGANIQIRSFLVTSKQAYSEFS